MSRPATLRLGTACLAMLVTAPAAVGAGGVRVGPADVVPMDATALGPLCRLDTPAFRLWWTDTPGAPGAVAGADGSCGTVPAVVAGLADSSERARAQALALGFPAVTGDAPPLLPRTPGLARILLRNPPAARAALLRATPRTARGAFLVSLRPAVRGRITTGLPPALRSALARDVRVAERGRPSDFVGGDRRVDVIADGTGATGLVREGQPGLTRCLMRGAMGRRGAFAATWAVVLADASPTVGASLAHELFHAVQCRMEVGAGTPAVVREGTAEWFAATADPAGFAGAVTTVGGSRTATGGAARVISYCSGFDPDGPGVQPYLSWGIWQVVDGPAGGGVRAVLDGYRGVGGDRRRAADAIARVGGPTWAAAVGTATASLCGDLRSPSGEIAFAPEVRGFIGALGPTAAPGAPAALSVAPGGAGTATVTFGPAPPESATVSVRAAGVDPSVLRTGLVAVGGGTPLPVRVAGDAVLVDVPAEVLSQRAMTVTIGNPLPAGGLAAEVSVTG